MVTKFSSQLNVRWLRRFVSVVSGFGMVLIVANGATGQSAYAVLHGFTSDAVGRVPLAKLIQGRDGDFYGTTSSGPGGDPNFGGSVFKITAAGILTTLRSFVCSTDGCGVTGAFVQGGLIQARDGDFYGTTPGGGAGGASFGGFGGTVFKITAAGTLTALHAFDCGTGSCIPVGSLIQASDSDDFYGMTSHGAADGGTVFKITPDGVLTTLHSFASDCDTGGCLPLAGLIQASDGNLYGTTVAGGSAGEGTVFKITATGTFSTLHSFNCNDGCGSYGNLIEPVDGTFYGTTVGGGAGGCGTVFKITAGTLTTLHSFRSSGLIDGCRPHAGLILATDGNFYGTTAGSSFAPVATIFKITTAGILTTVHTFDYISEGCGPRASLIEGCGPHASLIQATDGQLYGTAPQGGPGGEGVVFRFTLPPPPPNDDVDNATVIRTLPFTDSIDMSLATVAADDPLPSCADPLIGNGPRTTWYSFTPDHDVQIAYDAVGSSYEPGIAVYTGSRGALTEVHCSGGFSAPVLHAKANVTYLFFIQNLNGSLVFNVREPLSALSPARIWIGLKNSDDVGLRLDLLGEVFIDSAKVGEGRLNNVRTGGSGFNNAGLHAIPLELTGGPVNIPLGSTLRLTVSARRTCSGGGHASGIARLWYNGQPVDSGAKRDAGSRFDAISGSATVHNFLRAGFERLDLDTAPGTSKRSLDVSIDSMQPCPDRTFKSFGTWSSKP